jgi:hypothetical protein
MPIRVICPNGHHMSLPDSKAGQTHRCPLCFANIDVPTPGSVQTPQKTAPPPPRPDNKSLLQPPLPSPQIEQTHEERHAERNQTRLSWVDRGLGFHYARLVVVLLFDVILGVGFRFFAVIIPSQSSVIPYGVVLPLMIAALLGLIGSILCLRAPPQSKARILILLALLLDLVVFPSTYFIYFNSNTISFNADGIGLTPEQVVLAGIIVGEVFQLISWICFVFYLRQLALHFHEEVAADEAIQILVWGIGLLVVPLLLFALGAFGLVSFWLLFIYLGLLYILSLASFWESVPSVGRFYWLLLWFVAPIYLYFKFLLKQLSLIATVRQVIRRQD